MVNVFGANIKDLDEIMKIDSEVIGNTNRRDYVENAIKQGYCIVIKEKQEIVGFLIYETNFFENYFISLVVVAPLKRRKGYASLLINQMLKIPSAIKIFSSTNRSNTEMQKVFSANGFIRSGMIENLDEGDPEVIYFKSK